LKESSSIFEKAITLIKLGRSNEACQAIVGGYGNEISRYLVKQYGWNREEALSIVHDAFLLVEEKTLQGEIETLNKTYFVSTCKYIGSNQYRKNTRRKDKMNEFIKEEMRQFNEQIFNYCDVQVFPDDNEFPINWQAALRAFSLLTNNCQEYIKLKYVEGCSHEEILTKSSAISTIRTSITTLNRCVKRWKELFGKM
jgi:DNA-directed RNA polymerase specialized sigma24 family protein